MILTDGEVRFLKVALSGWELFGYVSTGIVFLGCVGEFLAEFTPLPRGESAKRKLSRLSLIILILGIGGELLSAVRTSQLSGQIIANIDAHSADAEQKAAEANDHATANERETEIIRKSNLELQAKITPRRLSSEQKRLLAKRVRAFTSRHIFIGSVNGGTEGADFALDFNEVFRNPELHFEVEFSTPTTIVSGLFKPKGSLQVEAGGNRKHDSEVLVSALVEIGIGRNSIALKRNDNPDSLALTIFPRPVE
jgi:hypothetical protein